MSEVENRSAMLVAILLALFIALSGCSPDPEPGIETRTVNDEAVAEQEEQVLADLEPELADGFDLALWAPEELLSDPVAIHMDHLGRAWVSITERRRTAELDIRGLRDWEVESIGLETTEERRELIHRRLSPELGEENDWPEDMNEDGSSDWRDLTVPEESVFLLEDGTGSGQANRSSTFVRGFNDEMNDVAGAVLYHQGDVFLGVSPDMWRIRDTTGDGHGDSKESIAHGFGVNVAFGGHGMSGLTVGPDGRLYWSIGDPGMSVVDKDDRRWHYPRQGVIVRSEPDGSDFEVFAHGLRNTHEFSFDKYGNLITVDNDGDYPGEHERLVYLIDGSDSGWRINWQFGKFNDPLNNSYNPLMDEGYYRPRFEDQAAHLLPPLAEYHSGPAGMTYNPGTALSDEWADHFFVVSFVGAPSRSRIHAFSLEPDGASFRLERDEVLMDGILATGLDVGPDGALYFTDWIEGWNLKQAGRIWRLDTPETATSDLRAATQDLLARSFDETSSEELSELLDHADMRVRQKAQFELAEREELQMLVEATAEEREQLARIHGIWGVGQIARRDRSAAEPLIGLLTDSDSQIRSQAARVLGDVRLESAASPLVERLQDNEPRVKLLATEALGRIGAADAFDPIVKMLEENDDEDVYLRHAGAIALERLGLEEKLVELSDHSSRAVRIAALVALQRMESPGVSRFLNDPDSFVVTSAARAINDDRQIGEAIPDLAAMLDQDRHFNEPLVRRALNANLQEGESWSAERLVRFALREELSSELRTEALEILGVWEHSSTLDRVTGDPGRRVENPVEHAHEALEPAFERLLESPDATVVVATLESLGSLRFRPAAPMALNLLEQSAEAAVRTAALGAIVRLQPEEIEQAVQLALEDSDESVRMYALRMIPDLEIPVEARVELLASALGEDPVRLRQEALATLGEMRHPEANRILEMLIGELQEGELDRKLELDLIHAVEESGSEPLLKAVREIESRRGDESLEGFRSALYGGDADEGRRLFYESSAAQCIRCHVVRDEGSPIGPDLTTVADRLGREELLESMVDPDARVAEGYGTVSGMPSMAGDLSRSELRDLVEYLSTLRDDASASPGPDREPPE